MTALALSVLASGTLVVGVEAATVEAPVLDALARSTRVEVVVALRVPAAADIAERKVRIRAAREALLDSLPQRSFRLTRSWETVAGMMLQIDPLGLEALAADPAVISVGLDGSGEAHLGQSLPLIGADSVHAAGTTAAGSEVAVIDSGARVTHSDLSGAVVAAQCFCNNGGGCCPNGSTAQSGNAAVAETTGHGTNVASIISSDGNAASTGVAPDASVSVIRIFNSAGSFVFSDLVSALDWLINNRLATLNAINMSIGSYALSSGVCDDESTVYGLVGAAIDTLREAGVLAVASAGNSASDSSLSMPACLRNVMAVGATYDANIGSFTWFTGNCTDASTAADKYACWSNTNAQVDVAAPGCRSTAACSTGNTHTCWWCGTSQASPHVAATAALIASQTPWLTAFAIEHCLSNYSLNTTDAGVTMPLLDAADAVSTCTFGYLSQGMTLKKLVAAYKKPALSDDKLVVKGLVLPTWTIDPLSQAFSVMVADGDGEAFSATIPAADPAWRSPKTGKYVYKDRSGRQRGIVKALVKSVKKPAGTYKVMVKAVMADLARADSTNAVTVEVAAGSNLFGAIPSSCKLKAGKKLTCK